MHAYTHVKGTATVPNTRSAAGPNNRNEKVTCKSCDSFNNCISKLNNTEAADTHDMDVVMCMYNSIDIEMIRNFMAVLSR